MENLHVLVNEYAEATLELISCLEKSRYDNLDAALKRRQDIIEIFKTNSFDNKELIKEFGSMKVEQLDSKAVNLLKYNMDTIKEKIRIINSDVFLKKNYNQGFSGNPLFFNKKI